MAKDINIHLKTHGAQQTKQQIDEVGQSAKNLGTKTDEMGEQAKQGGGKVLGMLKKLVGPIGFMAIATVVASAAAKIARFFDDLKKRTDEAVREVQEIRSAYTSLFEAMDAFDEKSRQVVTKQANLMLQETRVTEKIGLPVIDAYTRQFRAIMESGQITKEQYDRGLKEMLGYAERHGGEATRDLVAIISGWGMVTPEQQGAFRRQIAAGAQQVGLTDEDIIEALGRGMPTIRAMGWTPQQAIEMIATVAAGEVGRKKKAMPATTLQALMAPQLTKIAEYEIPEEIAEDPRKLLEQLAEKRTEMDQKVFTRMLVDIYGTEAAAGVSKMLTAPRRGLTVALVQAASEVGAEAERAEEEVNKETLERRGAATEATKRDIALRRTIEQQYMKDVREIGWKYKKDVLRIDEPVRQWFGELLSFKVYEDEWAAYRKWLDSLSKEERKRLAEESKGQLELYWQRMPAKEKYEALIRTQPKTEPEPEPKVVPQLQTEPTTEKPQVSVPVETEVEQQQVSVPVETEVEQQQVSVPVETEVEQRQVNVPVETEVEQQQVNVPVETEVERQQFNVPVQPVAMSPLVEHEPQTIIQQHYYYDYGIRYFPRIGDDESGPRIEPGAIG